MQAGGLRAGFVALGCALTLLLVTDSAKARDEEEGTGKAETKSDVSDQARWAGHVGVGFYGMHAIPLPQAQTRLIDSSDPNSAFQLDVQDLGRTVSAPAIGIRYWFGPDLGLDVAIGFWTYGGTDKAKDPNGTRESELESRTAFLLHGGLPIVLGGGRHVSVQLTPEVNLGFAGGKWKPAATGGYLPPSVDESGFLLQVGSRIGAEVFFGFVGMPELSLDASLGLHLQTRSATASAGNTEVARSDTTIATNNFNSPWEFFTSSLAARYYF